MTTAVFCLIQAPCALSAAVSPVTHPVTQGITSTTISSSMITTHALIVTRPHGKLRQLFKDQVALCRGDHALGDQLGHQFLHVLPLTADGTFFTALIMRFVHLLHRTAHGLKSVAIKLASLN